MASERLEPGPEVAPGVFLAEAPEGGPAGDPGAAARRQGGQRIVGGSPTTIADWPWQAAITLDPTEFGGTPFQRQFCGGTLVSSTIVVTAAHCVYDGGFTPADDYASITGRARLSDTAQGQEILWNEYFVLTDAAGNQLYNPNSSDFDVVFAQLATPSSSSNSTPIQIAGADEAGFWAPGDENAFVTGWGTIFSGGPKSDDLLEAQIDMIADSVCGSPTSYGSSFHPQTMVCAGEIAGGQDTCQGDSGGPLVVPIGGGTFRLVGDTSFGFGCALPNFPGVYGRVAQDPICGLVQSGIQAVASVDVVGLGGCRAGGDSAAPETAITRGPRNRTKKKKATIEFSANEPATFDCTLDNRQQFKPCTSPTTVRVKRGRHTFQVRATDLSGNTDGSPATDSWKRKRKRKNK